ncbi:MAG: hypothetical protein NZM27_04755 [Acetobacteraceae bacterium]|nr:hypothetical protein [Acetobacteraceae bacterium]MDW8399349.1 hypothetical protein [Acetobacteraceae bacterium]
MHPPKADPASTSPAHAQHLAPEAIESLDERAAWALALAAWLQTPDPSEPPPPMPDPQPDALGTDGPLPWLVAAPVPSDWWM